MISRPGLWSQDDDLETRTVISRRWSRDQDCDLKNVISRPGLWSRDDDLETRTVISRPWSRDQDCDLRTVISRPGLWSRDDDLETRTVNLESFISRSWSLEQDRDLKTKIMISRPRPWSCDRDRDQGWWLQTLTILSLSQLTGSTLPRPRVLDRDIHICFPTNICIDLILPETKRVKVLAR